MEGSAARPGPGPEARARRTSVRAIDWRATATLVAMGYVDVSKLSCVLPDGRVLFSGVSFRVGEGAKTALVGANGTGKTTLLRMIAGDLAPDAGAVARTGGVGVMRQFIGSIRDDTTVRDLLLSLAAPGVREAGLALDSAELAMMEYEDEKTQLRYATALSDWADAHGYDAEVVWDKCTMAALGVPYEKAQFHALHTLSGGEQKRLALEALLRGPDEVLLLDEPDNYLDVPGKRWLEAALAESPKTVLFVSHEPPLAGHVEVVVRLVEQQHLVRPARQRLQREPLLLTAGPVSYTHLTLPTKRIV